VQKLGICIRWEEVSHLSGDRHKKGGGGEDVAAQRLNGLTHRRDRWALSSDDDGTMARPPGSRERTTHPHSGVRGGTADKMVGGPMGMGAGLWPHPYGTACQGEREKGTAWERAE